MEATAVAHATIKYVRARMPGRELVHLVPADALLPDNSFDGEMFLVSRNGPIRTLCGKSHSSYVLEAKGQTFCLRCWQNR